MTFQFTNNATTTLSTSYGVGATSMVIAAGGGVKFPTPAGANVFRATVVRASDSAIEVVEVTARTTDTMTVTRAQEGTTALAFVTGDKFELRVTAAYLNNQDVAVQTNAATSKPTPVDADAIPITDSATTFTLKKLTWANLKATLKAYFDPLYSGPVWVIKTTGYTAIAGDSLECNTTAGAFSITLPITPTANQIVRIADYAGTFATNALTVVRNGANIMGLAQDMTATTNNVSFVLTYIDATQGWRLT